MSEISYSENIANSIRNFLTEDDWSFSFDDQRGLFKFGVSMKGKIRKLSFIISVRDCDYNVYGISTIGADSTDDKVMASMAEFICRANYGLRNGSFELDMRDGEIRYKTYVDCGEVTLTKEIIGRSIQLPAAMFERYGEGIVGILFADMSAKEAADICEGR